MKIKFLGATGTVTGSKYELNHDGLKILVDCGLYQGPRDLRDLNRLPLENVHKYDAVILTHAHIDHSGYIPCLTRHGYRNKIYSTEATYELCKILLIDAAKLQEEDAKYANKTRYSSHFPAEPLYTELDALEALTLFSTCVYNNWNKLNSNLHFRFIRNGHILGSSCIQFKYVEKTKEERILTFTGDLGGGRSQVIRTPETIEHTNYLISESTYGDRRLKKLDENEFAQAIEKVYKREGTLIIPAFSVGRTQEILYLIKKLQNENKINSKIPVYLDSPMAEKASKIYSKFPQELKLTDQTENVSQFFIPTNFRICESTDESMLLCMSDQPKIVISASGMLQGGRVMHHLRTKLPDAKNAVLFTGYQGQGTKGLLLKNGISKIRIHHQEVDVEAEIIVLDSLSAHADSDELISWYRNFKNIPDKVFLTHGETQSLSALQYRIRHELNWNCEVPVLDAEYDL